MKRLLTTLITVVTVTAGVWAAVPPDVINYQGVLRDADGNPLDGNHDMVFRFHDDDGVGNLLLTDSHTGVDTVIVSGGLFNAQLGAGTITPGLYNTLAEVFANESEVWLEIEVDSETLAPRVQVISAGYAMNAKHLEGRSAGEFVDISSTAQTKTGPLVVDTRGVGDHGIEGYGNDYGGVFEGSVAGGDFRDADGTSSAKIAVAGKGILASGDSLGVEAWGNHAGIEASGDWAGGQFWTEGGSGDCRAGYGNIGVWADGDIGIQATGTQAGGYFDSVGIGTNTPSVQLDVVGDAKVSGLIESTSGGMRFPDGSVQSTAADTTVCDELAQKVDELTVMMGWLTDAAWSVGSETFPWVSRPIAYVGNAGDTSVAIGADGNPVISFRDADDNYLKVAHCDDVSCLNATLTDVDFSGGYYSSIAIGGDGLPVISHQDSSNDLKVVHCDDLSCTSSTRTTLESDGTVGSHNSIAIGSDGLPVISYNKGFASGGLKVAHCDNPSCTSATLTLVDSGSGTGFYTSIAIGSDNLPVISYHNSSDLKVAHCDDVLCSSATVSTIDSVDDVGLYTSIAIGADGNPVISYHDNTNGDLKFAHCSDVTCSSAMLSTVDDASDVGWYTAVAILDRLPVISYKDVSQGDLKVAHCLDAGCTSAVLSTVDSFGDVGNHTSIVIRTDRFPVITHTDSTFGDLKVTASLAPRRTGVSASAAKSGGSRERVAVSSQTDRQRSMRPPVVSRADGVVGVPGFPIDDDGNAYANSFRARRTDLAGLSRVSERVEAGDVLVIDPERPGLASLARRAADSSVFGVVATEPGVILGAEPPRSLGQGASDVAREEDSAVVDDLVENDEGNGTEVPVTVSGVALCKVDAGYGDIRPGDLLTTSPTPGHAMRTDAPLPGTILGKALEPLDTGTGMIKVLVMLR